MLKQTYDPEKDAPDGIDSASLVPSQTARNVCCTWLENPLGCHLVSPLTDPMKSIT